MDGNVELCGLFLDRGTYGCVCETTDPQTVAKIDVREYGIDAPPSTVMELSAMRGRPAEGVDDLPSTATIREMAGLEAVHRFGVRCCVPCSKIEIHPALHRTTFFMQRYAGSLSRSIRSDGPLSPRELRILAAALFSAIHDLHERAGLLHRDIKPANVLLRGSRPIASVADVALCDFGLSTSVAAEAQNLGTLPYAAPEVLFTSAPRYGPAADVWSAAATILSAAGAPGFGDDVSFSIFGICVSVCKRLGLPPEDMAKTLDLYDDESMPSWPRAPEHAWDWLPRTLEGDAEAVSFLRSALQWRPEDRLSTYDAMTHPYLSRIPRPPHPNNGGLMLSEGAGGRELGDKALRILRSAKDRYFRPERFLTGLTAREHALAISHLPGLSMRHMTACVLIASKTYDPRPYTCEARHSNYVYNVLCHLPHLVLRLPLLGFSPSSIFLHRLVYETAMSDLFVDVHLVTLCLCVKDLLAVAFHPHLQLPATRDTFAFCRRVAVSGRGLEAIGYDASINVESSLPHNIRSSLVETIEFISGMTLGGMEEEEQDIIPVLASECQAFVRPSLSSPSSSPFPDRE